MSAGNNILRQFQCIASNQILYAFFSDIWIPMENWSCFAQMIVSSVQNITADILLWEIGNLNFIDNTIRKNNSEFK